MFVVCLVFVVSCCLLCGVICSFVAVRYLVHVACLVFVGCPCSLLVVVVVRLVVVD